jgi:DNA-binding MarR family transcriptional regulator
MAKELQVSASSITRQAQSLQETGKIVMTEDPDDRRGYLISLTDEGRAELVELERLGMEFIGNELSEWDADKVQILGLLLSRLVETLAANHEQRQRDRAAASRLAG